MKGMILRVNLGALVVWTAIVLGGVSCAGTNPSSGQGMPAITLRVQLPSGVASVDVYWPETTDPAPLVIIAHGFSRNRRNMSGWGRHLAREGFVAVVPDLPARSDHARNGRFITDLKEYFCTAEPWKKRIDPARTGLMGFSAGGLSTLLSAANSPGVAIWIGLDPVDRNGMGAKASTGVQCRTVVLTAEPSSCNAQGNARGIIGALPHAEHFSIPGAVHVDAEWPTSWAAELVCGRSTEEKRTEFRLIATRVLQEALAAPPASGDLGEANRLPEDDSH